MPKEKTLDDLFLDGLKDIYHAEKQALRALQKMAKAAHADELRDAFVTHREETGHQIERLEQVFEQIGKPARGKPCQAIQGLVEEATEIMEEYEDSPAHDAALIGAAQAQEHYEIARYGTLKTWAAQLGYDEAAQLLGETLEEEKKTDGLLTQLAEASLNEEAEDDEDEDEDDGEEGEDDEGEDEDDADEEPAAKAPPKPAPKSRAKKG